MVKQVVPSTAPPGSTTGAVPAGGWQFAASTATSGVVVTPTSGSTAVGSGAVSFDLTFPGGTTTAPVTLNETLQPGYTLVPQGTFNASCRRLDTERRADRHQLGSDRLRRVGRRAPSRSVHRVQPRAPARRDAWSSTSSG